MSEKNKIDVFKHEAVPVHSLLTKDETKEVLNKYRIQPYQLPHIKITDPAVREIKAMLGDVVKVIRKSPTSGESIAYRYVVKG